MEAGEAVTHSWHTFAVSMTIPRALLHWVCEREDTHLRNGGYDREDDWNLNSCMKGTSYYTDPIFCSSFQPFISTSSFSNLKIDGNYLKKKKIMFQGHIIYYIWVLGKALFVKWALLKIHDIDNIPPDWTKRNISHVYAFIL